VVTVTVLDQPPLTLLSGIRFNPQTGLYQQSIRVSNPTQSPFSSVRVYIHGLLAGQTVYNASGVTNGVPYVQSGEVPAGGFVNLVIEYYLTIPGLPIVTLVAEVVPAPEIGTPAAPGVMVAINRSFMKADKTFLLEFATEASRVYVIQYSSDLKTWKTVPTSVSGNGTWIQWIDNGQPKTESAPSTVNARFYRVMVLP
jgi:hypothetical protein